MRHPKLEVADIFRDHGAAWREANAGHVSLGQLKVMAAIESCRTAALGGHVARCEDCAHTHRVAIANSRLLALDNNSVTFKWKDYRRKGPDRYKVMTLAADEFIRRFLIHVLPKGFHRIRHYGLFAKPCCADNVARARQLIGVQKPQTKSADADRSAGTDTPAAAQTCPCCGGRMIIIETFERGSTPHYQPTGPVIAVRIDTS